MADRKHFGKHLDVLEVPDLIGMQVDSYNQFIQAGVAPEKRKNIGFQEVFKDVFPIESYDQQCVLEFVRYELGTPKTPMVKCLQDGGTYQAPLHVVFRLKTPKDTKEEKVFMGEMPIMTYRGSFIINGAERVVVSQLHRSPGICFERNRHASGRSLYSFRIIPDRGSWLEVQFDINDLIFIYLDRRRRRRKFLISTFLRALGYDSNRELLDCVYGVKDVALSKLNKSEDLTNLFAVEKVEDPASGSMILGELEPLNPEALVQMKTAGVKKLEVVDVAKKGDYFVRCVQRDPTRTSDDALKEIYRRLRPGDPPNVNNARLLLKRLFFDVRRYDLGLVGRYKINQKLGLKVDSHTRILVKEDFVAAVLELMSLRERQGGVDDIDHLGSRRVRTIGELLQNQCRSGLTRTERQIHERMTLFDREADEMTPGKLVNPKPFASVIKDFFCRNQLSQFMDQTNCLAELTNKRRLSALGPGGLSRERAGFEARDVHSSHYGRICPIETPEGPNIGLISSLAIYGRINQYGFIETPYRRVKDCVVSNEIDYLTADVEENFVIAQANAPLDENNRFAKKMILCRHKGDSAEHPAETVQYMDVSPRQLVSAAAGLVPFLEHNDANRALMGSNMQRQAVPLLKAEAPLVGTGLERVVAKDSRAVVAATRAGVVASVSAERILINTKGKAELPEKGAAAEWIDEYELCKFMRSNASTLINQRPLVRTGDKIKAGQVIADGSCTEDGELALGRNVLVAFLPWCGYNFEDAIVISERLVRDDVYTSVHISEFEVTARDTKLGPEEITRDITGPGEEALANLDSEGIIRIGAEVKPRDILVGKITPKSETELAPEERLLRAIFGEKASDVKDTSLRVPDGTAGIVMDVRVERRVDPAKEKSGKADAKRAIKDAQNAYKNQSADIIEDLSVKLAEHLLGAKLSVPITGKTEEGEVVIVPADRKITKVMMRRLAQHHSSYEMSPGPAKDQIDEIIRPFSRKIKDAAMRCEEIIERLEEGNGCGPGVVKSVKVYIAAKLKISVGDKMAGRHGNKGILAAIVPDADMPFMADGTPVDIVLNPLGVPSRMNIGQVLETHLGWAASVLGMKVATPVFDGISEEKIQQLIGEAKAIKVGELGWKMQNDGKVIDNKGRDRGSCFIGNDGKTVLFDGRTGEPFDQRVVVGNIYMLKLDHLVVDKIHARATGPYSLVTQQPLGGKAQQGGQRFGEMEVWALEAYGAAHTLQEMLTVKSDDTIGRTKIYDSIQKGSNTLEAGVPESFNVLMKEMQSLCLDIRVRRGRQLG